MPSESEFWVIRAFNKRRLIYQTSRDFHGHTRVLGTNLELEEADFFSKITLLLSL